MKKESAEAIQRLDKIARLIAQSEPPTPPAEKEQGRNWWTRFVDAMLFAVRRYIPPLHWVGAAVLAICFYLYARLCALTTRLKTAGDYQWPEVTCPGVLALWHGCANTLIVAIAARQPNVPLAILIASDPRGDSLSLLCRLLGLRVVRVSDEKGGWAALALLADEIARGVCVIITADGGGPARMAKAGAVALSSVTSTPIVAVGADCSPAIRMPHKWDAARTPLPFCRIAVTILETHRCPEFADSTVIEASRLDLQHALNEATAMATQAL
ncbi:MAG: DUF374 domain-containing protein [Acidobacteria bacterium]|nr:DUF374 domain-containing protein [Acidobacteriota bacterium]